MTPFECFSINNSIELQRLVDAVDITVSERGPSRTKVQKENWSIVRTLRALLAVNQISFPMSLRKREKPDYEFCEPKNCVGLEITECVPEELADYYEAENKNGARGIGFVPRISPGSKLTHNEIHKMVQTGSPAWYGDSVERDFVAAIKNSIEKKTRKALSHYDRYPTNWLHVYNNWPGPALKLKKAGDMLLSELQITSGFSYFDVIFVEDGNSLLRLTPSNVEILEIPRAG